ncbi:MAG: hypothetical protein A2010_11285 [Nitrospirae bacterium GWD2_57_9]|nr:MAG: hypothetical protein A2010_11285 [Nitrospirae bacterium GWD2_57_9]
MDKETSEITKLTERIAKDPRSKLFVPLAEEYKKSGDVEMAIHVLTEGLRNNPGYITARSFLGKLLIEKGDLPAAQKEFEEVVKAIPDNLMAQRKLGDLYALQSRPADALKQYRIVLSLNPKDSETTMLIAEAEAGHDITKHLALPKAAAGSAPETQKEKPPPASPQPRSAPVAQNPAKPLQPMAAAEEEPEDVLVVEPLDEVISSQRPEKVQKPAAGDFDFLDETAQATIFSDDREHTSENASANAPFSLSEPVLAEERDGAAGDALDAPFTLEDEVLPSGQQEEQNPFALEEPFAVQEASAGHERMADPLFELNVPLAGHEGDAPTQADDADAISAEIIEEPEKKADDFTTDTLAELYISQGFFEKAVDIYERMLVDKPNSQGLKDKLINVRAMAAAAGQEAGADTAALSESGAESAPAAMPETEKVPDSGAFIPAINAAQPRLDDWELPASIATPAPTEEKSARPRRQPKPFDIGFEPREYVPPDALPRQGLSEKKQAMNSGPPERELSVSKKPSDARKKETVDRLESWLKNIIKEN